MMRVLASRSFSRARSGSAPRTRPSRRAWSSGRGSTSCARQAAPGAEAGDAGPADRRRRPRLQQPADPDHRQPRSAASTPGRERASQRLIDAGAAGGEPRGDTGAAAPRLRAAAGSPSAVGRRRHFARGHEGPDPPLARPSDRGPDQLTSPICRRRMSIRTSSSSPSSTSPSTPATPCRAAAS